MENLSDNEDLAKRFLLGSASESECTRVEDRLLADDDFYQELLATEDDLIDAYARGQLPSAESALFEQRYLSSGQRRARVEFAKTLYASVSGTNDISRAPARDPDPRVSWWRSVLGPVSDGRRSLRFTTAATVAIMLLLAVMAGIWLLRRERARTPPAPQEAQTIQPSTEPPIESPSPSPRIAAAEESSSPAQKEIPQTPAKETAKRATPVIATFTLLPGTVRGGGGTQLALPASATEVRLKLALEGEAYKKYRAELSTPEGTRLWSRVIVLNKSSANPARLTLNLPAGLLKDSDYVLAVSGMNAESLWESVADYSFRVVRK